MGNDHEFFVDEINTQILNVVEDSIKKSWDEEFEKFVKKKVYTTTYVTGNVAAGTTTPLHSVSEGDRQPFLSRKEAAAEGYPLTGPGSPGWCKRGNSPVAPSGYYDSNGADLWADDRPKADRSKYGSKGWINGFLSKPGYWIFGQYAGEEIMSCLAYDKAIIQSHKVTYLTVDMFMTEVVAAKENEELLFVKTNLTEDVEIDDYASQRSWAWRDDLCENDVNDVMEEYDLTEGQAVAYMMAGET